MHDTPGRLQSLLHELARREQHNPHDELVRLAVRLRGRDACEYCLMPTSGGFQVDHIIPPALWPAYLEGRLRASPVRVTSAGPHHLDNFAWCCSFRNRAKGQRVEYRVGRRVARLFNPRRDRWSMHFVFVHNYLFLAGLTGIGRATAAALGFNDARLDGPLGPRHDAALTGNYPPAWARRRFVLT